MKMKFLHNVAKGYMYLCEKFKMRTIFQSKDMIQQVELFEWPSYNYWTVSVSIIIK